jgi:alkanesulfonate monooxygenase SsuD/methylene tetrahydromethanopterin reductase-like flavin-dependent oxidoreductase (luciferase family)
MTADQLEGAIAGGLAVGSPEEVIAALKAYEAAGVDQVVFNPPIGQLDLALEVIRVMGEKVIPHFDRDPIHRTTRHRYGARAEAMAGQTT